MEIWIVSCCIKNILNSISLARNGKPALSLTSDLMHLLNLARDWIATNHINKSF